MIERFQGETGNARLIEALRSQRIVQGDEPLARELCKTVELRELSDKDTLIEAEAEDDSLYFILAGSVKIVVNGRDVAMRAAGEHVGEMALVDPKARRSATVKAAEPTIVASISEPEFADVADRFPRLWRLISVELCDRLRQRNVLVRPVNLTPRLFIGSSTESLSIAREIQDGLDHDDVIVRVWTDKVFGGSRFAIEELEETIGESDFGVLVVGPDDRFMSRDKELDAPRDNVVLELGMCIGSLSRNRTFLVHPRDVDLKIPTDILGMKPLEFAAGEPADLASRLGPVCNELRRAISELGSR